MAGFLLASLYGTMVTAGLAVGYLFEWLGLVPGSRHARIDSAGAAFTWSPTTYLDLAALALTAALVWRFFATGGGPTLRMMDEPMAQGAHSHHREHGQGDGHAHAHG